MSVHTLGSGPIDPTLKVGMTRVAHAIDSTFNPPGQPKRVGFVLMAFNFGDIGPGRCNYVSNAKREDVITLLTEQLAYFKGMPEETKGSA